MKAYERMWVACGILWIPVALVMGALGQFPERTWYILFIVMNGSVGIVVVGKFTEE
jgi:hypothetical protein